MRYSGFLVWNCLPNNVKCSQTAETVHNRCIKWLSDAAIKDESKQENDHTVCFSTLFLFYIYIFVLFHCR